MNVKKISLTIGSLATVAVPTATLVSCSTMSPAEEKGFTYGMAVAPVSSLNYIKYKAAVQVSSSLVEGFAKGGPNKSTAIYNYLNLPHMSLGASRGGMNIIDNFSYQSGTLRRYKDSENNLIKNSKSVNKTSIFAKESFYGTNGYIFNLNGQAKWSNGEKITSSSFIDSAAYILDINTASQRISEFFGLNIKGSREFVEAQNAYAKKFGTTYKNPFGYIKNKLPENATEEMKSVWAYEVQRQDAFPLQLSADKAADERKYVDEIERTARGLGVWGDRYSSHPKRLAGGHFEDFDELSQYTVPYGNNTIKPFKIDIESNGTTQAFSFIINGILQNTQNWLPVNRRFIEETGGIDKFGIDQSHFMAEGPFKIRDMILGANGNLFLEKDENYQFANEIIPKSVKLFFQQDPVVSGSLFEDGYISSTKIDSIYTRKFFSDEKFRKLIVKKSGYGMTGFTFNLDKETNTNKYLLNPHLRKALMFAINRQEMIKVSGFDSTFPSYSLLEPTVGTDHWSATDSGVSYGNALSSERIQYSNTFSAPAVPSSSIEAVGMTQLFGHPDQTDKMRNIEEAKKEFEIFKKEEGVNSVSIEFLHNSSPMVINMALAYKSQLDEIFGGAISLDIKGLPASIYDSYISSGKFQMTWKNMDYFTHINPFGAGVDMFLLSDGIRKNDMKSVGFTENPTGSWTLADALEYYKNHTSTESMASVKNRLGVNDSPHMQKAWDKIEELVSYPAIPGLTTDKKELFQRQRVNAFFQRRGVETDVVDLTQSAYSKYAQVDPEFDTTKEIIDFVLLANRIIMDQAAVAPIFRVDVSIFIDRFPGVAYTKCGLGLGYLYDLMRKPNPDLPGLEVKG